MVTMNISLPESMRDFIEAQITKGGYGTVSEYMRALVREAQKREEQEKLELEAKLLVALKQEAKEMTDEDWKEIRRQVRRRYGKTKKS